MSAHGDVPVEEIARLTGHSDIRTTETVYRHGRPLSSQWTWRLPLVRRMRRARTDAWLRWRRATAASLAWYSFEAEITKLVDRELVPRFQAEHGRVPNQRELAALQERATPRTRVNKDGVTDWDAAARGWQAAAPLIRACR